MSGGPRPEVTTRRARRDDIDLLLSNVQAGFNSYVEFAGLGWAPPDAFAGRQRSQELLGDPSTWALIALVDDSPAGHVAFCPARVPGESALIPGMAHVWQLFVLPAWWGRGVAPLLHAAAIAEMQVRGYRQTRLYTPTPHRRARHFYERRGWSVVGEEWNGNLALMLCQYRRAL
jgi:GNAT superfamily N-acetyltransferase